MASGRLQPLADDDATATLVGDFNKLYHSSKATTWKDTHWLGVAVLKCPLDLWIYQELVHAQRPDLIIETGTHTGGSALFLATMCDLIGHGRVLTIDIENRPGRPSHRRIEYLLGSSTDPAILKRVSAAAGARKSVLVILDSDHSDTHVLTELREYSRLVRPGGLLIVEDTNIDGIPVRPEEGPGPHSAV